MYEWNGQRESRRRNDSGFYIIQIKYSLLI